MADLLQEVLVLARAWRVSDGCSILNRLDPQHRRPPLYGLRRYSAALISGYFRRLKRRVAELFEHRPLLVKHRLSAAVSKVLKKGTRGQPQLRAPRAIMDEVYRMFDRRCRMTTALGRLE